MKTIKELMTLRGRTALITGGAGHIGRAIAEAYAELGASVALVDLDPTACDRVAADIAGRFHVEAIGLPIDLEVESEVRSAVPAVLARLARLDVLVNSAALVGTSRLEGWATALSAQRVEPWRRALEVNMTAPFVLMQAAAEPLRKSGHGAIINVASIYGVSGPDMRLYEGVPMGNPAAYGASKGGLLQMTRWFATALAPHVRVNAISPGGVWRDQPGPFVEKYVARTPMQRMATEEDMKGAAVYLASDLSAYVTGQNLLVDGGWTAW